MLERLLGYRTFSYEDWLVEYHGTVIYIPTPSPHGNVYFSPGVSVVRNSAGNFTVFLTDKVPIRPKILNQNSPTTWFGALDAGFCDTLQIYVQPRNDLSTPTVETNVVVGSPVLVAPNRVSFNVLLGVAGTPTDMSWSFNAIVTGQPQRFVFGLGA